MDGFVGEVLATKHDTLSLDPQYQGQIETEQ